MWDVSKEQLSELVKWSHPGIFEPALLLGPSFAVTFLCFCLHDTNQYLEFWGIGGPKPVS